MRLPLAMRRRLSTFAALFLIFVFLSLQLSSHDFRYPSISNLTTRPNNPSKLNYAIAEETHRLRHVSSIISSVSVLLADWEVLVIIDDYHLTFDLNNPLRTNSVDDYVCLFQNNATSPAKLSGRLSLTNRIAFKCIMPNSVRRLRPFFQPILLTNPPLEKEKPILVQTTELYRWTFLVYESFSTENDVVLFVKGVNNRQGINRSPNEFRCVFYEESNIIAVKTAVTSSTQEAFRCPHPNITAFTDGERRRVSLEIINENLVVPSVAYYVPRRKLAGQQKSLLCACTMVYNAGKFLKEWVTYHSNIGVDKFIIYDNDSNDNLKSVVEELNGKGYNITTMFWVWPKTQEAGYSHSAVYGKDSCTWMMYVDVDEFVFSPSWSASSKPSKDMLKSLLPRVPSSSSSSHHRLIGQVSIRCNEFGPSNQHSHPIKGVTQGYTCRMWAEQRHKSIVQLDAVDPTLLNAIHHFGLKSNYKTKTLNLDKAVVNHYKYQAWAEFQNKFRRRVSTYVVDWKEKANLGSKDRTPGLGFEPIEPEDWAHMFCEVKDERLKMLTKRWFGSRTSDGYRLVWQ